MLDLVNLTPTGHKLQAAMSNPAIRTVVWHGPVRSGKSASFTIGLVEEAVQHLVAGVGNNRYFLAAPTAGQVRRNLEEYFRSCCKGYGLSFKDVGGETPHYLVGGFAKFFIFGAADAGRYKSLSGAGFMSGWIDEATLVHESFLEMAITRLDYDESRLYLSMNADNPFHPIKTEFIDKPTPYTAVLASTFDENQHFSDVRREELRTRNSYSHYFKRLIENEWVPAAGLVFPIQQWMVKPNVGKLTGVVAVDPGVSGVTAAALFVPREDRHGAYQIAGEYEHDRVQRGPLTDAQHVDAILSLWRPSAVVVDPITGGAIGEVFRQRGYYVVYARREVEVGIIATMNALTSGILNIADNMGRLLAACGAYVFSPTTDKPVKENDHLPDCMRYGGGYLFPATHATLLGWR